MDEPDLQGDAGHLAFIDRDIDGVGAVTGKGKLLEIQDQIAGREKEVVGEFHVERSFHGWDDGSAIFIDKQDADGVKPFLFLPEKDAKGDGTLGMNGGKRSGDDGIEGAKEAKFSVVIGRGIAEGGDLNFHAPEGEGAGRHGKRKFGLAALKTPISGLYSFPISKFPFSVEIAAMHDKGSTPFDRLFPAGRKRRWIRVGVLAVLAVAIICGGFVWGLTGKRVIASSGGIYFVRSVALSVPGFRQADPRWHADALGNTKDTLGSAGCAVSSAAMVLKWYGVDTDPGRLNAYLTAHQGYVGDGWIVWEKAAELGRGSIVKAYEDLPSYWGIDRQLIEGNPVIVRIHLPGGGMHFVVIAGKRGFDYLIMDPGAGWNKGLYPLREIARRIDGLRYYRKG